MQYLIYKLTHIATGKCYIGKTKDFTRRLKQHIARPECRYLHKAILKYGIDSFSIQILEENLTFEQASVRESHLIIQYNSLAPIGYNLVNETDQGRDPSKETRKLMGQSQQKKSKKKEIGVRKKGLRYLCRIQFDKKEYCKSFQTKDQAQEAYDKCCLFIYGTDAKLNFPHNKDSYLREDLESHFQKFITKKKQSSNYKGVAFHKAMKKWRAYYYESNKFVCLGFFNTEQEAYERAKTKYPQGN